MDVGRSAPRGAVFLSYASQDAEAAKRIADALRGAGVEVWFDAEGGLEHGDEWDAKIRRQIKECVLFVAVISANTQAREEGYFRLEWDLAAERARSIASGVAFILPVAIDGTAQAEALVPDRFRSVQWTKLPGGQVSPDILQRFLKLWSHRTGLLKQAATQAPPATQPPAPSKAAAAAAVMAKRSSRGKRLGVVAVALALGLGAAYGWRAYHQKKTQQQCAAAVAEIQRRLAAHDIPGAFAVAENAIVAAPDDAGLRALWDQVSVPINIETTPAGAQVSMRIYPRAEAPWRALGVAPLAQVRVPNIMLRFRFELAGMASQEIAMLPHNLRRTFDPAAAVPADMVKVAASSTNENTTGLEQVRLGEFFIDRFEVTNRQFKKFVDQGGYANPAWWREPFLQGAEVRAGAEAMKEFVDSTGQPGPASWKNGTYAAGTEDHPVTGVSWFEAAAYAAFVGKRLPTIYHWRHAAALDSLESIVPLSNFAGRGAARVGSYQGMSAVGAFDMAGNAKEWCANEARPGTRYILGGAWSEPEYMFTQRDAMSPWDRSHVNGFRCMQPSGQPIVAELDAPRVPQTRNYADEKPVNDETFAVILGLYSYDKQALDATVEATDDSDARWRREKVSYRAAYGGERITAYVFLPKNSAPPYQTIVFFPGSGSMTQRSSETLRDANVISMLTASGRALIYPVYKGTYERGIGDRLAPWGSAGFRDWIIMLAKDVQRTVDYLETRPDIQADKLAYMGNSWGGAQGAVFPAIERRFKASVLMVGGFYEGAMPPEIDQINFAPHITTPTLMLSGRYDFRFPLETSQRPMFRWLGASPENKKHVLYDTGHSLKPEQIAGEVYAWLDKYLGYVR